MNKKYCEACKHKLDFNERFNFYRCPNCGIRYEVNEFANCEKDEVINDKF